MTVARLALTWVVTWPALVSCDSGTGRKSLAGRTRAQPSPCALSFHTPERGGRHPPRFADGSADRERSRRARITQPVCGGVSIPPGSPDSGCQLAAPKLNLRVRGQMAVDLASTCPQGPWAMRVGESLLL